MKGTRTHTIPTRRAQRCAVVLALVLAAAISSAAWAQENKLYWYGVKINYNNRGLEHRQRTQIETTLNSLKNVFIYQLKKRFRGFVVDANEKGAVNLSTGVGLFANHYYLMIELTRIVGLDVIKTEFIFGKAWRNADLKVGKDEVQSEVFWVSTSDLRKTSEMKKLRQSVRHRVFDAIRFKMAQTEGKPTLLAQCIWPTSLVDRDMTKLAQILTTTFGQEIDRLKNDMSAPRVWHRFAIKSVTNQSEWNGYCVSEGAEEIYFVFDHVLHGFLVGKKIIELGWRENEISKNHTENYHLENELSLATLSATAEELTTFFEKLAKRKHLGLKNN